MPCPVSRQPHMLCRTSTGLSWSFRAEYCHCRSLAVPQCSVRAQRIACVSKSSRKAQLKIAHVSASMSLVGAPGLLGKAHCTPVVSLSDHMATPNAL